MQNHYLTDKHPWGTKPSSFVVEFLDSLKSGSVLDLGVGDGRNAIFLAQKGFDVVGIDNLQDGLDVCNEFAIENNVQQKVKTVLADICEFDFEHNKYSNILAFYTLKFLGEDNVLSTIKRMKEGTEVGGVNMITDFTKDGDIFTEGIIEGYYFDSEELKNIYSDWDIIHYSEVRTETKGSDKGDFKGFQTVAKLVARKI